MMDEPKAADVAEMFHHISEAFAIADRADKHSILLEFVYQYLSQRFGHERVERDFSKRGKRGYSKEDRAFGLIYRYAESGKSQEEFARWAAQYNSNKELPRSHRLGTQTANEGAMLKALKRALRDHPRAAAVMKRLNNNPGT
jgi:hypothetical protein